MMTQPQTDRLESQRIRLIEQDRLQRAQKVRDCLSHWSRLCDAASGRCSPEKEANQCE